jgi:hypothetical protein
MVRAAAFNPLRTTMLPPAPPQRHVARRTAGLPREPVPERTWSWFVPRANGEPHRFHVTARQEGSSVRCRVRCDCSRSFDVPDGSRSGPNPLLELRLHGCGCFGCVNGISCFVCREDVLAFERELQHEVLDEEHGEPIALCGDDDLPVPTPVQARQVRSLWEAIAPLVLVARSAAHSPPPRLEEVTDESQPWRCFAPRAAGTAQQAIEEFWKSRPALLPLIAWLSEQPQGHALREGRTLTLIRERAAVREVEVAFVREAGCPTAVAERLLWLAKKLPPQASADAIYRVGQHSFPQSDLPAGMEQRLHWLTSVNRILALTPPDARIGSTKRDAVASQASRNYVAMAAFSSGHLRWYASQLGQGAAIPPRAHDADALLSWIAREARHGVIEAQRLRRAGYLPVARLTQVLPDTTWKTADAPAPLCTNDLTMTLIETERALVDEGAKMRHCVHMFRRLFADGRAVVYHVEFRGTPSTLMLVRASDGTWTLREHKGPSNAPVCTELEALIERWLRDCADVTQAV